MSPAHRLVWSPESLDDLRGIRDYIALALGEPRASRRQVARIRAAARGLKAMPARHPVLDWEPWRSRGVRRMAVDNYAVLYVVEEDRREVRVARVLYGARDLDRVAREG